MARENQIIQWADRLRDVSATGYKFTKGFYDRENYQKILEIIQEMFTSVMNIKEQNLEVSQIPYLVRPGPLIGGDGAIINSSGEMLLIKRADNKKWAMPGGLLQVGETPAEGVMREILEETGIKCQLTRFIGIYDSRLWGSTSPFHIYQLLFLGLPISETPIKPPSHGNEVISYAWFTESSLPDNLDPGHVKRISEAFKAWRGETESHFDGEQSV